MELSSSQGCRFCRAKSEELCRQSGSGWMESLRLFWKASCCSCSMSRLACCRSASRSSAVCRLHPGRERDSTVTHWALLGHQRAPALPGKGQLSPSRRGAARRPHTLSPRPAGRKSGWDRWVLFVHPGGAGRALCPPSTCTLGFCGFANNKSCFFCVCFVTPCGITTAGQWITDSALRPVGSLGPTGGLAGCAPPAGRPRMGSV